MPRRLRISLAQRQNQIEGLPRGYFVVRARGPYASGIPTREGLWAALNPRGRVIMEGPEPNALAASVRDAVARNTEEHNPPKGCVVDYDPELHWVVFTSGGVIAANSTLAKEAVEIAQRVLGESSGVETEDRYKMPDGYRYERAPHGTFSYVYGPDGSLAAAGSYGNIVRVVAAAWEAYLNNKAKGLKFKIETNHQGSAVAGKAVYEASVTGEGVEPRVVATGLSPKSVAEQVEMLFRGTLDKEHMNAIEEAHYWQRLRDESFGKPPPASDVDFDFGDI